MEGEEDRGGYGTRETTVRMMGDTKFDTRFGVSKALFIPFFYWGGADVLTSSSLFGLLAFIVVELVERALVMP